MSARGDGLGDFHEMHVHRRRIAEGQDEGCRLALFWADRAKDVGRSRSLIMWRGRSRAAPSPSAGDFVLLPYSSFVSPPDFDWGTGRERRADLVHLGSEALFLKASASSGFCA